jgi:hypothetical protein
MGSETTLWIDIIGTRKSDFTGNIRVVGRNQWKTGKVNSPRAGVCGYNTEGSEVRLDLPCLLVSGPLLWLIAYFPVFLFPSFSLSLFQSLARGQDYPGAAEEEVDTEFF